MAALRKWLFTGLLVIVPGVITAWVLSWIVSTLDQTLAILPGSWQPDNNTPAIAQRCQFSVIGGRRILHPRARPQARTRFPARRGGGRIPRARHA